MQIFKREFGLAVVAALFLIAGRAEATPVDVRLGLGGDYWTVGSGVFQVNASVGAHLARPLSVGGRFGALITTSPLVVGIPLDLYLRVKIPRAPLYFEGTGGPWVLFTGAPVRGHVAFGFGLQTGDISFGVEMGYLQPSALLGVRLGFQL